MCGIAGILARRPDPGLPDRIECATDSLQLRGPDGRGVWTEGPVALGHRRLAIIDTSERGAQPMHSAGGRFVITYNGEIYNYRELRAELSTPGREWRSESDTEVILAAYERWGADSVRRLNGMFAFAIYDRERRNLFVARDRLGVKPLYYTSTPGAFAFGSRPRAVNALLPQASRELSPHALRLYVEAGYIPAPLSVHAHLRQLPPGYTLEADLTGEKLKCYWSVDSIAPAAGDRRTEGELLEQLDELLTQSVRSRMLSDVPLGAFLSGGIDSAVVVAKMAAAGTGPVRTFTIGFDDPALDESPVAARIAAHLGVANTRETMSADGMLSLLDAFFDEYDEPLFDSSALPTMAVARLARREVVVALSGDGGDELFGGYHYYGLGARLAPALRAPRALRALAAVIAGAVGGHRGKLAAGALRAPDLVSAFAFMRSVQKDFGALFDWPKDSAPAGLAQHLSQIAARFPRDLPTIGLLSRLDLLSILPGDYLYKVDGATMAFSVEAREPLLDYRLVEWSAALPDEWKSRGGVSKYLLRRLAARHLPPGVDQLGKRGFVVPIERWLRGPLQEWARDLLAAPELYRELPVSRTAVEALFDEHLSGRRNAHPLLWSLCVLAQFLRKRGAAS